jgi:hypothetical protein
MVYCSYVVVKSKKNYYYEYYTIHIIVYIDLNSTLIEIIHLEYSIKAHIGFDLLIL